MTSIIFGEMSLLITAETFGSFMITNIATENGMVTFFGSSKMVVAFGCAVCRVDYEEAFFGFNAHAFITTFAIDSRRVQA